MVPSVVLMVVVVVVVMLVAVAFDRFVALPDDSINMQWRAVNVDTPISPLHSHSHSISHDRKMRGSYDHSENHVGGPIEYDLVIIVPFRQRGA